MYPSLDSSLFDLVLTQVFKEKARLGSARSLSLKTQSTEKGQNESISDNDATTITYTLQIKAFIEAASVTL